jgi:hypothetical protein
MVFPSILYVLLNGWEANGPLYFSSLVIFRMNCSLSRFFFIYFLFFITNNQSY